MLKEVRKYVNGEYITEMVEVEESECELTDSERIAILETRQDIADSALEELIFMMMEGE